MKKYVCLSYRGPTDLVTTAGGVAAALTVITNKYKFPWCFCLSPKEKLSHYSGPNKSYSFVSLTENEWQTYYLRACNTAMWPLFHETYVTPAYRESWWEMYKKVNQKIVLSAVNLAQKSSGVEGYFVNDFQLLLAGKYLRRTLKDKKYLVFFLHIPWPQKKQFTLSPWAKRIIESLLYYDSVILQTEEFFRNFMETLKEFYPLIKRVGNNRYLISGKRTIKVDWAPIGIDYGQLLTLANSTNMTSRNQIPEAEVKTVKFFGADRLDYIKGLVNKINWFTEFLSIHPEYQQKISLTQILNPTSRISIKNFKNLEEKIKKLVRKINNKLGTADWQPVTLVTEVFNQKTLVRLYLQSDVCIISSLRDGMNLVSKEFIAANTNRPVALIISNKCGASNQLKQGAVLFDPNNKTQFFAALKLTLKMKDREKANRVHQMVNNIKKENVYWWAEKVLN